MMRNLTRWTPRRDVVRTDPFDVFDNFENLVNQLWQGGPLRYQSETARPVLSPAMDVVENDHSVTVRMDLPGLSPDDVRVEIDNDVLTVSGEIGDTIEKEGDRYHYRERYAGSFQRSLRLPSGLQADRVDATFNNGVLSIELPKPPEAQRKQITVKSSKQ